MTGLGSWGLALAVGAAGGGAFAALGLPLAWMLGSMAATTAAALAGLPVRVAPPLRAVMIAVLGLMLGSTFSPALLDQAGRWVVSLAVLAGYVALSTAVVMLYFRRVARYDPVTAYFAAAPGGLSEMILVGGAMGGDDRTISLIHTSRILLIVFTVPLMFRWLGEYGGGSMTAALGRLDQLAWPDALGLAAAALAGAGAARLARLPAAALTGPMIASAGLHLAGLAQTGPPAEAVAVAQVVVGASVGCRFAGTPPRALLGPLIAALGSTVLLLAISLSCAALLWTATGLPFAMAVLAFVPGGLAEMCLIALALGADVAFVSAHHFVRIVLVVMLAPLAFRLVLRLGKQTVPNPQIPPP